MNFKIMVRVHCLAFWFFCICLYNSALAMDGRGFGPLPMLNNPMPQISLEQLGRIEEQVLDMERQIEERAQRIQDIADEFDNPNLTLEQLYNLVNQHFGAQDDAAEQTAFGRFLNKKIALGSVNIPQSLVDYVTNSLSVGNCTITLDLIFGPYDVAKASFFGLDLMVEQKLFAQCTSYFNKKICSRFDQKRDALIKAYHESPVFAPEDLEDYLVTMFLQEFCLPNNITLEICRIIGLSVVLHYIVHAVEESMVPAREFNNGILEVIRFFDALNNGNNAQVNFEVRPVAQLVHLLRYWYMGASMIDENMQSINRGFALSLVKGFYPADHWYHKCLGAVQTATEHRLFDICKKLLMWYRCINGMSVRYNQQIFAVVMKNRFAVTEYIKRAAQMPRGSKELKEADEYIKQLLRSVNDDGLMSWVRLNNTSLVSTSQMVEMVLMMPLFFEVSRWLVNVFWPSAPEPVGNNAIV